MNRPMDVLLRELGWTDGFHIPVANEDNRLLEKEVEDLLHKKADLIVNLEVITDSLSGLQEEHDNYKNEENQNQKMLYQRQGQLENHRNKLQITQMEQNRNTHDISAMDKEVEKLKGMQSDLQTEIDKMMFKLNKVKAKVEWGEDALNMWNEFMARSHDESSLVERIFRDDESEFKNLELTRQKLRGDVLERKELLEGIMTRYIQYELQLQHLGKVYRATYKRHLSLLKLWNNTVGLLRGRDRVIKKLHHKIRDLRLGAAEKCKSLQEKQKFFEQQKRNNAEMEVTMKDVVKQRDDMKAALLSKMDANEELYSELKIVQNVIADLGSRLIQKRGESSLNSHKIEECENEIDEINNQIMILKSQHDLLKNEVLTQAGRVTKLEEIYEVSEKDLKKMDFEYEKLIDRHLAQQIQMEKAKELDRLRSLDIKAHRLSSDATSKQSADISKELLRQLEIYHSSQFELKSLIAKICHLEGDHSSEERELHNRRIKELEKELLERKEACTLVEEQVKHAEQDSSKLALELQKGDVELQSLSDKKNERVRLAEGLQKTLSQRSRANQQLQAELVLLQLRMSQAAGMLKREGGAVFSLEKQRIEIETAMQEKKIAINAQKDVLYQQKRAILEEKSDVKHIIDHLTNRLVLLQKRYEIALDMLGKTEDGEQANITHFKIKLAQERTELQEKGDVLDAKIGSTEKEILAMENTLKLMNSTNYSYKQNLDSIDANSPEMADKQKLENEFYTINSELRKKKQTLDNVNSTIKQLEMQLGEAEEADEGVQSEWRGKDREVRDLDRELGEQTAKLQRAEKQLKRVVRQVQLISQPKVPVVIAERDIETREMQDINNAALQQLSDLCIRYIETVPVVNRYLTEKDLALPVVRSSMTASISSLTISRSGSDAASTSRSKMTSFGSEMSLTPSVINLDPFGKSDTQTGRKSSQTKKSVLKQRPSK
ncbi:coiled-coil domain-containing protein 39-like isoform X2 [Nilaparvata lugens]|uniref:coiled-coil domain-containing protein 39-like isoform X2 n=1 Tax=Nilaparvata lugens TaxID=108931 RepID=UPI00193DFAA9|nr:coiled-coil domain-containing protein 39-like isoform X2 [Nilaparvata lugens]